MKGGQRSARVVQACGAAAIATSSAGVAFALGRPDGEQVARDEMMGVIRAIASSVDLPVTTRVALVRVAAALEALLHIVCQDCHGGLVIGARRHPSGSGGRDAQEWHEMMGVAWREALAEHLLGDGP